MSRLVDVLLGLCLVLGSQAVFATDFYVSPAGNDANAGGESQPFATLEAARDAVRTRSTAGELGDGGVTIWLRGGDYVRNSALELTAADSGTAQTPIVWRSYPGETARLLGGRLLTGFQPVSDAEVLARLNEKARDHVRVVDLQAMGISAFGDLRSRGFSRPTVPSHCELFFGGVPMTLARWPNEGEWSQIAGFPPATCTRRWTWRKDRQIRGWFLLQG